MRALVLILAVLLAVIAAWNVSPRDEPARERPARPVSPVEPLPRPRASSEPQPPATSATPHDTPTERHFIGRLVDAAGRPVVGVCLRGELILQGGRAQDDDPMESISDDGGRFRLTRRRSWAAGEVATLRIERVQRSAGGREEPDLLASFEVRSLVASGSDLGDVVWPRASILASGRIVDLRDRPVPGAEVEALGFRSLPQLDDIDMPPFIAEPLADSGLATTDADGRFVVYGTPAEVPIRLVVRSDDHFLPDPVAIEPGQAGLTVILHDAGTITGSVRLGEGFDAYSACVQGSQRELLGEPIRPWSSARFDPTDGTFRLRTLRPGPWRVDLRKGANDEDSFLVVDDVIVEAGRVTVDPRLQGVDPALGRRTVTVTVAGPDGEPLDWAFVHHRSERGGFWSLAVSDTTGEATLDVRKDVASVRLVIVRHGFGAADLPDVRQDTHVVLTPTKRTIVRVRLASGACLPDPPLRLVAWLDWAGASDDEEASESDPRGLRDRATAFDSKRVAEFETWSPGRYRVVLAVTGEDGLRTHGERPVATDPRRCLVRADAAGGEIEVVVGADPDTMRTAIDAHR